MTATATLTSTTPAVTVPADHTISVATAAAELGVKEVTVKRYLRNGKLTRLGAGVSADSVEAYKASREANVTRTRFKKVDLAELSDVELAAEAWAMAAHYEALARDLKAKARPVLDAAGPGQHGRYNVRLTAGRTVQDNEAVKAHYAEIGEKLPMKTNAGSFKVTRTA